ncbi:MAG: phosphotransferase [Acidobacteriota bacterium]|nr:phosphotransferase [Acidobacteriota bacterium]
MMQDINASAIERLHEFLKKNNLSNEIVLLTPDASTREYFRINWNNKSAIACVYPQSFIAQEQTFLDVTSLFLESGLPVAEIYHFDEKSGVIVQEDLGDTILRPVLDKAEYEEKNEYLNQAIVLIAKIQAATPKAFERNSVASKLKFDEEKLVWELDFFKTHYFETLRQSPLSAAVDRALSVEFDELARALENRAGVLCHRDFHAANLMIHYDGKLRVIDHQDARIGTASYDLVSLLLDRVSEVPSTSWIREKRLFFLQEREDLGLKHIDPDDFAFEFRLQTIQRCLKAIGTFSFQSVNRGKTYFIPYIEPMFRSILQACERLDKFPHLREIIANQIEPQK